MAGDQGTLTDDDGADERNERLCEEMLDILQVSSRHDARELATSQDVTLSYQRRIIGDRIDIPPSGGDHYLLQLIGKGAGQDGGAADGGESRGDIRIVDLARSSELESMVPSGLSTSLPRQLLEKAGSRHLHGAVLKAEWPMTALVAACIEGLCALQARLTKLQADAAQQALATLLLAAWRGHAANGEAEPPHTRLRQRVLEFMDQHIHLQELSPALICHRLNVSRAHLYRAFAADGGVVKMLRDMRLDAVRRELVQAVRPPRSITEMAYSLGFSSANQLLRSFRARFGLTPSEARAELAAGRARDEADALSPLARLAG